MVEKTLLCAYYPTTVIFVDDDTDFLDWLVEDMPKHALPFKKLLLPDEGASLFECYKSHPITQHSSDLFVDRYLNDASEQLDQDRLSAIANIHHAIYNAERFNEITVAVVDYEMPKLNGLDLCKMIRAKHPKIKLIMLTGKAKQTLAIEAFNDNVIDQFIVKRSAHLADEVVHAITNMQYHYFTDCSKEIKDRLLGKKMAPFFASADLRVFLDSVLREHQLVEYYLIHERGDFLMLDKDGNSSWLMIRDEDQIVELVNWFDFYEADYPNGVLETLFTSIRERKAFPFLYNKDDYTMRIEDWVDFMVPIKSIQLDGRPYYYTLLLQQSRSSIDITRLSSMTHMLTQE